VVSRSRTSVRYIRQAAWRERNPWARHVEWARRRCTDPKSKAWPSHGAKGIQVFLSAADAKVLWERDGAASMKKPSLDRRESDKHYCVHNSRFIEFLLNSRLPHDAALRAQDQGDPSWLHENPTPEFT